MVGEREAGNGGLALFKVPAGRQDQDLFGAVAEIGAEVCGVTREEVGGSCGDRCEQDGPVLLRKSDRGRKRAVLGLRYDPYRLEQASQPLLLRRLQEVSACLLRRVRGCHELDVLELPQAQEPGPGGVRGREQDVGI